MKITFTGITFKNPFFNKNQQVEKQSNSIAEYNSANLFPKITKENFIASNNISFGGFACSPESFDLKKIYGMSCPCCGKLMPTQRQMQAFAQRIEGKKGVELQKELVKGLPYYRTNEEEIANILIEATEEFPEANLQKLVEILAVDSKVALEKDQKKIIGAIRKESENIKDETKKKELTDILDKAIERIDNSDDDNYFKRNAFVSSVMELKEKYADDDKGEFDKAIEIAKTLPRTYTSKDAFFVKYQRKSTKEIAIRLFTPAIGTTEHAKPKSKNGENNTSNYLPMCSDCNFHRGNMPYNEWFKIHPEMPENLQKYINWINDAINGKGFKNAHKFSTYVDEIIETIKEETDGEVILQKPNGERKIKVKEDISPIDTKKTKTIEEQREEWEKEVAALQEEHNELTKIRKALEIDDEYLALKEYGAEVSKLTALKKEKTELLSEISRLTSLKTQQKINIQKAYDEKKKPSVIKIMGEKINKTTKQHEKAKLAYQKVSAQYEAQRAIVANIKKRVQLPEEIQGQISSIRNRIAKMDEIRNQMKTLREEIKIEDDILFEMGALTNEILIIKNRMEKRAKENDLESKENKKALEDYFEILREIKVIDNISILKFKKLFGGKNVDPPMFILNEAKESLNSKLEKLKLFPSVEQHLDNEELKIKEEEKATVTEAYDNVQKQKTEIRNLRQRLNTMKLQGDTLQLLEQIEKLNTKKEHIKFKYKYINIGVTIKEIEEKIAEIWQKYTESFEG